VERAELHVDATEPIGIAPEPPMMLGRDQARSRRVGVAEPPPRHRAMEDQGIALPDLVLGGLRGGVRGLEQPSGLR
jgi:hypothetical protein